MTRGTEGIYCASELFQGSKEGVLATFAAQEGTRKKRVTGFVIPLTFLMIQ